jgi:hypothetical protein
MNRMELREFAMNSRPGESALKPDLDCGGLLTTP